MRGGARAAERLPAQDEVLTSRRRRSMNPLRRAVPFVLLLLAACREGKEGEVIRLNGRLETPTVDLGPKVPGRVMEVLVKEGDRVKAGDLLLRLDIGETAVAVERAAEG